MHQLSFLPSPEPQFIYEHGQLRQQLAAIAAHDPSPMRAARARHILLVASDYARAIANHKSSDNLIDAASFQNKIATHIFHLSEVITMPARNYNKPAKRAAWKGVLTCELTERQIEEFDETPAPVTDILVAVDRLTANGYKFSLSYSKYHKAAQASMTDEDAARDTGGYTLSANGSDCMDALAILLYKHFHILGEDWTQLLKENKPKAKRG